MKLVLDEYLIYQAKHIILFDTIIKSVMLRDVNLQI